MVSKCLPENPTAGRMRVKKLVRVFKEGGTKKITILRVFVKEKRRRMDISYKILILYTYRNVNCLYYRETNNACQGREN